MIRLVVFLTACSSVLAGVKRGAYRLDSLSLKGNDCKRFEFECLKAKAFKDVDITDRETVRLVLNTIDECIASAKGPDCRAELEIEAKLPYGTSYCVSPDKKAVHIDLSEFEGWALDGEIEAKHMGVSDEGRCGLLQALFTDTEREGCYVDRYEGGRPYNVYWGDEEFELKPWHSFIIGGKGLNIFFPGESSCIFEFEVGRVFLHVKLETVKRYSDVVRHA